MSTDVTADRHVANSIINAIVEKTSFSILEGLLLPFCIYYLFKSDQVEVY